MSANNHDERGPSDESAAILSSMRAVRAAVRARALEAVRRNSEPYRDAAVAEQQLERAAARFADGSRQLDEAALRRFYATLWDDEDLEDLFVSMVVAHDLPAGVVPSPPADLAARMAATARTAATQTPASWRSAVRVFLGALVSQTRQLLGPAAGGALGGQQPSTYAVRTSAAGPRGSSDRPAPGAGRDVVSLAEAAVGDARLQVKLTPHEATRWLVSFDIVEGDGEQTAGSGAGRPWEIRASLDGYELTSTRARGRTWILDEALTLEQLERVTIDVMPQTGLHGVKREAQV